MGINWGDAPTWGAVIVGTAAATAALIQLRQQGNVLKGEVERNKRRDELLDGQLNELQLRERLRDREQAEKIDLTWTNHGSGSYAQVVNDSRRPIRHVEGQIRLMNGDLVPADRTGELMPVTRQGVLGWEAPKDGILKSSLLPVIRGGGRGSFEFHTTTHGRDGVYLLVRFTDDAGLRWSLDHDLHLVRLDNRDDW